MRLVLPLALLLSFAVSEAHAQRGTFGIGGQIGDPTGVALKFNSGARAFDLAAGWDLDDDLFVQSHLLLAQPRFPGATVDLHYFYGPGAFLAIRSRGGDDDVALGFSFNGGIAYYTGQIEIFGQLTPQLSLVPDTDFTIGVGVGVRFYP